MQGKLMENKAIFRKLLGLVTMWNHTVSFMVAVGLLALGPDSEGRRGTLPRLGRLLQSPPQPSQGLATAVPNFLVRLRRRGVNGSRVWIKASAKTLNVDACKALSVTTLQLTSPSLVLLQCYTVLVLLSWG